LETGKSPGNEVENVCSQINTVGTLSPPQRLLLVNNSGRVKGSAGGEKLERGERNPVPRTFSLLLKLGEAGKREKD